MFLTDENLEIVRHAVMAALSELEAEIYFDRTDPHEIRIQAVSDEFEGMSFTERFRNVYEMLVDNYPTLTEQPFLRIESYTPDGWAKLPSRHKGD